MPFNNFSVLETLLLKGHPLATILLIFNKITNKCVHDYRLTTSAGELKKRCSCRSNHHDFYPCSYSLKASTSSGKKMHCC